MKSEMQKLNENFHSREGALNLVFDDHERVQYDENDPERIKDVAQGLTLTAMSLIKALGSYRDAIEVPVDEDSPSVVKSAREELVEAWAYAQEAVSKIGWCLRLDGNEAYAKLINSRLDSTYPLNFSGM